MLFLLFLYCTILLTTRSHGAELFEFGVEQGDQVLSFSNDSYAVTLDVPIIYFEESQNELFISSKGIVTFGKAADVTEMTDLDQERINAIAIFFAQNSAGKIFYRATSSDTNLLNDLTDKIRKNFPNRELSDFTALHAVVITWSNIEGEDAEQGLNEFQMVLVTDGMSSYVFLIYDQITWTGKNGHYAQAGLYCSDGRRETMVNSGTPNIRELVNLSNNQKEGTYIFRISGATPEDPRGTLVEDDYNYNDYEQDYDSDNEHKRQHKPPDLNKIEKKDDEMGKVVVPSQREEINVGPGESTTREALQEQDIRDKEPKPDDEGEGESKLIIPTESKNSESIDDIEGTALSCAIASKKVQPCSLHAKCNDYNPGYCCECLPGYYGNGEECLKDGEPQRINGGFEGVINGKEMDRTELHTYVMVEEGRSYTALSQIPPEIGRSLLLLNAIGSAMGWLFAKVVSSTSYNGFMLTGGLFNRTVNVHIGDRYMVTIKQQFSGRDIYHYFKAHMFISGTLPILMEGAEVIYSDHDEEYRREGPGFLRSYSSQMVTIKENGVETQMKLSTDQQIHYKECPFREFTKDPVVVIHVSRIHVVYDVEEHIVRYASANMATKRDSNIMIAPSGTDHHQLLHTNQQSLQQQQQQQYRNQEYHLQKENVENQRPPCTNCLQNACESGRHLCKSPNMICAPVERSYRCECVKGYQAEYDNDTELGWKCIDMNECERGEHKCNRNAICINLEGTFECRCADGYEGDGYHCRKVRVDGELENKRPLTGSGCLDHRDCHQWGECIFGRNGELGYCKCRGWYTGDGVHHCGPPTETEVKQVVIEDSNREQAGQTCGEYMCDVNAYCDSSSGSEQCECQKGYHGNGISCVPHFSDQKKPNATGDSGDISVGIGKICRSHDECGKHGNCVYNNELAVYRCICVPPYFSDGVNCVESKGGNKPADAKTCREASDCHQNAHCVVRENSLDYFCECLPGYRGDGVTRCTAADDCTPGDEHACHKNAVCVFGEVERTYTCKCAQGFVDDGRQCVARHLTECNEQPGICHKNAQCVYSRDEGRHKCICKDGTTGDGYENCREEVKMHRCGECSSHARCMHDEADDSWRCRCMQGYIGNGHLCTLYTNCLDDRSLCDEHAECVPNEYGHYICNCHYGYHGNGRTCTPDSESREEAIFICRGMTIIERSVNPDLPGKQLIVVPHQIAVGIDFDCQEERIVWSDIAGHSILSASINGTNEQKFMDTVLKSPEGIAIDWSSRNVYYADSVKDEIGVASLDGKYYKTLINEGLVNPRALAIDLTDRYLYYSDWHRENPVIGRVRLDGTENSAFISTEVNLPNGLTVLLERRELCWVDAGLQHLSCIGLNGQNRRVVYAPLQYPFGLTVHNEQRFYWTDWSDNKIHSVSVNGDGYISFPATTGGSGRLYGLVSVPLRCKGVATACAVNNGGCEHLCLPGKIDVTCACPDNIDRC
uniref:Uncharacterized protein n=1 Tax=Brugia malayi TaxID=6279 RepID=A0A5S6PMD5_BRUMA